MDDEQYKTYISSIINRLNNEKLVYLDFNKNANSKNLIINVKIQLCEWYHELDDDIKYNVEYNLQQLYTPAIMEILEELKNKKNT